MQQEDVNYASNFSPFVALVWMVIVVSIGCRSVGGALQAAGAFVLFEPVILKGALFGWLFRDPERIPDFFPISGKWVLVLFGLGTIMYARHPEGMAEYGAHRKAAKAERRRRAAEDRATAVAVDVEVAR